MPKEPSNYILGLVVVNNLSNLKLSDLRTGENRLTFLGLHTVVLYQGDPAVWVL